MLLKFEARDHKKLRTFLLDVVKRGEDYESPASKIWTSIKANVKKSKVKDNVIVTLEMEHLIPTIIWKFGIVCLVFSVLFWVWFLIPAFILLFFGFLNTKLFMFMMLKTGLKRAGYVDSIKRIK